MSIKRAAEIIRQVLTFGRGVSGERVAVNPAELMDEVSKIIGQTFPKDITITQDASTDLWPIIGDKTQIHQVLLNLCINARDAMPKGGGLSLLARNFTVAEEYAARHAPLQAGPYVMLQVTDTGEGILPANIEKIFDPFFTTKTLGKGTGLGLSTVLGIVKSHHGLVTVDTELNKGTTFQVLLPASPVVAKRSALGNSAPLPHGRGETILIVDDEVAIVSATREMLEKHGYKVEVAGNGREALAIFVRNNQAIELVLTDNMMPVMDGIELIRVLKEIDPQVKIIASSGLSRDLGGSFRAEELKALDVKMFLSKPYTAEKLLIALHESLGEKQKPLKEECVAPVG
jgi:two-component system, cell cycle sensor histidine kinase and response regulator CckA